MKSTELNTVMKGLIFPSKFVKSGRLAYYTIEHESGALILVGFYLDGTIDKNSFFLQYFVQCLYDPFVTYNFSLGDRIGHYWSKEDVDSINVELQKFVKFDRLNSFEDFIKYLKNNPYYGHSKNPYFAYTHFILHNYTKSARYIKKILALKKSKWHPEWFEKQIKDAELINDCITKKDYDRGIEYLLEWQKETITALKITF